MIPKRAPMPKRRRGRKRKVNTRKAAAKHNTGNTVENKVENKVAGKQSKPKCTKVSPEPAVSSDESLIEVDSPRSDIEVTISVCEHLFGEEDDSDDFELDFTDVESWVDIRCSANSPPLFSFLHSETSFEEELKETVVPPKETIVPPKETKAPPKGTKAPPKGTKAPPKGTKAPPKGTKAPPKETIVPPKETIVPPPEVQEKPKVVVKKKKAGRGGKSKKAGGAPQPSTSTGLVMSNEKSSEGAKVQLPKGFNIHSYVRKKDAEQANGGPLDEEEIAAEFGLPKNWKQVMRVKRFPYFLLMGNATGIWKSLKELDTENENRKIYDRYQRETLMYCAVDHLNLYRTRNLSYEEQYSNFLSPYTKRVLKPLISRDYECSPLWLRVMDELEKKANVDNPFWIPSVRDPISYYRVRNHQIPAINSLAALFFWPGINLAPCLEYPEFSCVAFYKKLLVGFAFAVPNFSRDEVYVLFVLVRTEWRRAGIGRFMLNHLIKSCEEKDMALHVSPTNRALMWFKKFGFKVDHFEPNFYSRYLPYDSSHNKNAFYLCREETE